MNRSVRARVWRVSVFAALSGACAAYLSGCVVYSDGGCERHEHHERHHGGHDHC